jgi:hypothetical protein
MDIYRIFGAISCVHRQDTKAICINFQSDSSIFRAEIVVRCYHVQGLDEIVEPLNIDELNMFLLVTLKDFGWQHWTFHLLVCTM